MDNYWAQRQRNTNKLVRICYRYLVDKKQLTPEAIHGLFKLTWITRSYEGPEAGYLWRTKLPGLGAIFREDYSGWSLDEVADDVTKKLGTKTKSVYRLITGETGFTNFRYTYRNSAFGWIKSNRKALLSILRRSYQMTTKKQGKSIVESIEELPKIPSPSGSNRASVELMLTPLCFSLAEKMLFPVINGSAHVNALLKSLDAHKGSLTQQYAALSSQIGKNGVKDAADLDTRAFELAGGAVARTSSFGKRLKAKSGEMAAKDEADYKVLQKRLSIKARRIHNKLTNQLLDYFGKEKTLLEGKGNNRFDVLIPDYKSKGDVLVEVKSTTHVSDIRMAIGQLYDYYLKLDTQVVTSLAVLLPKRPTDDVCDLLEYAEIGLLYFDGNELKDEWW